MTELIPSRRRPVHRPVLGPAEASRRARRRDRIEFERLEVQLDALEEDIRTARRLAKHPHVHRHPPLPALGEHVRLADGAEIVVRPVEPGDAPLLREGFAHLGAVSRFRRFLGRVDHLGERDARFLTDVDHVDHEAFVALDAATGAGIAVARYIRDPEDAALAVTEFVVLDEWQHRGVGTLLADRLAAAALANGITCFAGRMMLDDHAAEHLLEHVGAPIEKLRGPGTVRLTVRLG